MSESEIEKSDTPVPKKKLFGYFAAAYIGAAALLVAAVLPAEYGIDPLGIGKLTGISKLAEDREATNVVVDTGTESVDGVAHIRETPFKTKTLRIDIADFGSVEHKLLMSKGDTVVFSWQVEGETSDGGVYFDMHGHPSSENKADFPEGFAQSYQTGELPSQSGGFAAPFDGYHGWYLLNIEARDITVVIELSGYWEKDIELYREVNGEILTLVEY